VPQLDKFVSEDAFERVCQRWLLDELDDAVDAGRWWGPIRRQVEAVLLGLGVEALPTSASHLISKFYAMHECALHCG
jgi:hypothetical protein